jgi:hypothetical protein
MLTVALTQVVPLVLLAISDVDVEETDFSGLGKMMLAGFLVAVAVAIAITFVRLRIRDKKPGNHFVSISESQEKS